jgi:hypothetical protein
MVGYFAAGFGLLRVPYVRNVWTSSLIVATIASLALLSAMPHVVVFTGIALDIVLLCAALVCRGDRHCERACRSAGRRGSPPFEPAHFIMQQRMMRGIRDRAERLLRS